MIRSKCSSTPPHAERIHQRTVLTMIKGSGGAQWLACPSRPVTHSSAVGMASRKADICSAAERDMRACSIHLLMVQPAEARKAAKVQHTVDCDAVSHGVVVEPARSNAVLSDASDTKIHNPRCRLEYSLAPDMTLSVVIRMAQCTVTCSHAIIGLR